MSGIKVTVSSLDEVAEPLRPFYSQNTAGKFEIEFDGVPSGMVPAAELAKVKGQLVEANAKVGEFRDTSITMLKAIGASSVSDAIAKIETLKAVDPEENATLKARLEELSKKGIKGGADLEALEKRYNDGIQAAISKAVDPIRKKLEETEAARTAAEQRAARSLLRSAIGDAFGKAGGQAAVLDYVISKAEPVFDVVENEVKAKEGQLSPIDPSRTVTVEEWMAQAVKQYPFAFAASTPGVQRETVPVPGHSAPRPGVKKLVNPTPEQLGDPKVAEALRKGELQIVNQ